jgi:uncharacterized protein (TIGR02001 family)
MHIFPIPKPIQRFLNVAKKQIDNLTGRHLFLLQVCNVHAAPDVPSHERRYMRSIITLKLVPVCFGLALFPPLAAAAEPEIPPPAAAAPAIVYNVTLASQYISRGFRQTWGKPALQAGADYAHPSGLSVGTWMSTVSSRFVENATVEWDVYGGYSGSAGPMGYSAIVMYYFYPGAQYKATATT